MMRDIKFEIMFLIHGADFEKRIAKHYTTLDRLTNGADNMNYDDIEIVAKRQFTGLQDKNGVDIYEDDIVDDQFDCGQLSIVSYDNSRACFILTEIRKEPIYSNSMKFIRPLSIYPISSTKGKVIGNIHSNPELLEK